jgi:hypothetical protein
MTIQESPHPDAIADCVLNTFNALPQKFKPRTLADGRKEWSPLAGIVLSRRTRLAMHATDQYFLLTTLLRAA